MSEKREVKTLLFTGEDDTWSNETVRSFGWRIQKRSPLWRPPTDVYETEDAFVIVVEVAGMRGTEISVTLDKGLLSIRGLRVDKGDMKAYHQMEIAYGEFETKVKLPRRIEQDEIEATYSDGFLRVVMPKVKSKNIEIDE
jgi:HSP20 family molecular chaperone IbpA